MHTKYTETGNKHVNAYKVYRKVYYSNFSICGVYLNFMATKDQAEGRNCFFDHHNDWFFGLARIYSGLSKTKSKDLNYPSLDRNKENTNIINNFNNGIVLH